MNSPILVWMLYLNREVTSEVSHSPPPLFFFFLQKKLKLKRVKNSPDRCSRNTKNVTSSFTTQSPMRKTFPPTLPLANHCVRYTPYLGPPWRILTSLNFPGQIIAQMMPLLMMRHRRIPRARWRDHSTHNGKHWIEQVGLGLFFLFIFDFLTFPSLC
jgi:hypothetical protein